MTDNKSNPSDVDQEGLKSLEERILATTKDLSSKLPLVGHVCWLYSQAKTHKYFNFADIEPRILPPLLLKQCKLYIQGNMGSLPMGFVSWARLSEEAELKYIHTQKLRPEDWKSGDRVWVIDMLAPFGNQENIFKELHSSLLKDEEIHLMFPDGDKGMKKTTINEILAQVEVIEKKREQEKQADNEKQSEGKTKH